MSFDEIAYQESFIKRLRGAASLPEDLIERYAMSMLETDPSPADIHAHLIAVRAYWNKRSSQSSSPTGQTCKLCRAADELLRQQHGQDMEDPEFWKKQAHQGEKTSAKAIVDLAEQLKSSYGPMGMVTRKIAMRLGERFLVRDAELDSAASKAGLTIVSPIDLPDASPVASLRTLTDAMSEVPTKSIPELLHPALGEFSITERFHCNSRPTLRIDAVAVDNRLEELDRKGPSSSNNAAARGLRVLKTAVAQGVDLRELTLFHLATAAQRLIGLDNVGAMAILEGIGLSHNDSAVIVLTLVERAGNSGTGTWTKIAELLADGQLREARQALSAVLVKGPGYAEIEKQVSASEARLAELMTKARKALRSEDEVSAVECLQQAILISEEDAAPLLATVPPSPPDAFRLGTKGTLVALNWRPGRMFDEVSYVTVRREDRFPIHPNDGARVYHGTSTHCDDATAPVARPLKYGLFAILPNGVSSRRAEATGILIPPVSDVKGETASSEVTVFWSVNPEVDSVEVTRRSGNEKARPVPAGRTSCHVGGLREGESQHFSIRAIYRDADQGRYSSEAATIVLTPRSEAAPIKVFSVIPIDEAENGRIRISWKAVDRSEVQIRHSDDLPSWRPGSIISASEMAGYGDLLQGRRRLDNGETIVESSLPQGVHHIVPFSIGGNGIVVGPRASIATIAAVRDLTVTPFQAHAKLSWIWPEGVRAAEVVIRGAGPERTRREIGISTYNARGVEVPLAERNGHVEVRAIAVVDGRRYASAPVSAPIPGSLKPLLWYSLVPSSPMLNFMKRDRVIVFESDDGCADIRVRVIASPGRIMPTKPTDGVPLLDVAINLNVGGSCEYRVSVPKHLAKPYWIRCFVIAGDAILGERNFADLKFA